ncbi:hypothetical protein D3C72_2044450 [compost metagenome]
MVIPTHIQLNHRAVLGNKRQALQPQILLDLKRFSGRFAAAQNDRNLMVLQLIQPRRGGTPVVGMDIQQGSIQIGKD